ncbi:Hypothetical protein MVR_LOCUS280 [uncultured virus]|nr:Hypothetical protein MVR_LOCUS280 [uncultured virus]
MSTTTNAANDDATLHQLDDLEDFDLNIAQPIKPVKATPSTPAKPINNKSKLRSKLKQLKSNRVNGFNTSVQVNSDILTNSSNSQDDMKNLINSLGISNRNVDISKTTQQLKSFMNKEKPLLDKLQTNDCNEQDMEGILKLLKSKKISKALK